MRAAGVANGRETVIEKVFCRTHRIGTDRGPVRDTLVCRNVHRQVNVQVDEAGRKYAIAAVDDCRAFRRFYCRARDPTDDAVLYEHVTSHQLIVDTVKNTNVFNQISLRRRGCGQAKQACQAEQSFHGAPRLFGLCS